MDALLRTTTSGEEETVRKLSLPLPTVMLESNYSHFMQRKTIHFLLSPTYF